MEFTQFGLMICIELTTLIQAPISIVFDAARNICLHTATQKERGERAVGGVTKGLIGLGEEVEWEASHFGFRQRLRVRITALDAPHYFQDQMITGAFREFSHEHFFSKIGEDMTEMRDVLIFSAPSGVFGWLAERLFLSTYMKTFLQKKNIYFKTYLESCTLEK